MILMFVLNQTYDIINAWLSKPSSNPGRKIHPTPALFAMVKTTKTRFIRSLPNPFMKLLDAHDQTPTLDIDTVPLMRLFVLFLCGFQTAHNIFTEACDATIVVVNKKPCQYSNHWFENWIHLETEYIKRPIYNSKMCISSMLHIRIHVHIYIHIYILCRWCSHGVNIRSFIGCTWLFIQAMFFRSLKGVLENALCSKCSMHHVTCINGRQYLSTMYYLTVLCFISDISLFLFHPRVSDISVLCGLL